MAKQRGGEIIVGLDIGTTKICAIVGELTDDGIDANCDDVNEFDDELD